MSAPFSDTDGRGGSVFLFINIRGELKTNGFLEIRGCVPEGKDPTTRVLQSNDCFLTGQFGLAVSKVGDLNKDGFQDFAVSINLLLIWQ